MRTSNITREQALALLREYNKEGFHIQHGLTVEGVMAGTQMNWDMETKQTTGQSADCCMILILKCIRRSIVRKHRSCLKKAELERI